MKKNLIVLIFVLLLGLTACIPSNNDVLLLDDNNNGERYEIIDLTVYVAIGDYFSAINSNHQLVVINNHSELLEISDLFSWPMPEYDEYPDDYYQFAKVYFTKNEIGYLHQNDGCKKYPHLFTISSNYEEWFDNHKLIFCSIVTTSSTYQAKIYLKITENKQTTLVLNDFNNSLPGDCEMKNLNFFIPIANEYFEDLLITLDNELVNYKS